MTENLELGCTSVGKSASTPVVCIIGIASLSSVTEEGGDQEEPFIILETIT